MPRIFGPKTFFCHRSPAYMRRSGHGLGNAAVSATYGDDPLARRGQPRRRPPAPRTTSRAPWTRQAPRCARSTPTTCHASKPRCASSRSNAAGRTRDFEERAFALLQDERIAQFDAAANDLLSKLDALGSFAPATEADCARLEELSATSLELLATVKAKAAYTLAKLDQMLEGAPVLGDPMPPTPPPLPERKKEAQPLLPPAAARTPVPPAPKAGPVTADKPPAKQAWSTKTVGEQPPPPEPPTLAPPPNGPPPAVLPPEEGFTIDEIKAASGGFFGKVSANLGAVIEHVFSNSGRPRAYILGEEGGGAFIAGVRYGSGTLYMREGGTQKIYWHGPSLGTDIGGDGSKTLFLVYRLKSPDQLFANFTGIDGSAYLVGGVGATLTTNGDVILAPIRSGVGLRLGANVGYIRFTPKQTWNPF